MSTIVALPILEAGAISANLVITTTLDFAVSTSGDFILWGG